MDRLRRLTRVRLMALLMLILFSISAVACQPAWAPSDVSEAEIQHLLELYEHEQMMSWVKDLTSEAFGGREAGTEYEDLAGDYIIDLLQSFGLEPWREAGFDDYRQAFSIPSSEETAENIIAVLPGESSDKYVLIGAHYDHIGTINGELHPGADDNAVGTAAVLEIARIFSESGFTPQYSVVFVLFGAEEKGLIGSQILAQHLQEKKLAQNVVLLNLDVIAGVSGNTLVVYDSRFKGNKIWAKRAKEEAVASGVQASIEGRLAGGVDSMAFTMRSIPAITLVWGNLRDEHPHLHTPNDTFENLNPEIVDMASRAAIRIAWAFAN